MSIRTISLINQDNQPHQSGQSASSINQAKSCWRPNSKDSNLRWNRSLQKNRWAFKQDGPSANRSSTLIIINVSLKIWLMTILSCPSFFNLHVCETWTHSDLKRYKWRLWQQDQTSHWTIQKPYNCQVVQTELVPSHLTIITQNVHEFIWLCKGQLAMCSERQEKKR